MSINTRKSNKPFQRGVHFFCRVTAGRKRSHWASLSPTIPAFKRVARVTFIFLFLTNALPNGLDETASLERLDAADRQKRVGEPAMGGQNYRRIKALSAYTIPSFVEMSLLMNFVSFNTRRNENWIMNFIESLLKATKLFWQTRSRHVWIFWKRMEINLLPALFSAHWGRHREWAE